MNKKVIVFGATGTVGKHLVEQSLKEGHIVSAFCRNADSLRNTTDPNLTTIAGDVFKPKDVQDAMKGQDVVCITLGSGKDRNSVVRSQGTKNIIEAMKFNGVKRLICQTTLGTGDSKGNLNFFWKNIMFGWFLKKIFLDHELQEEYVMNSGLDWTIVRPSAFTDGEKTSNYYHGFNATMTSLKLKISRADVADFILKQLQTDKYLRQTPGLSY
jgi:putative NADH-flavin reductase